MIDTKYGLKYSMPHSVVHIVDNSSYTGDLPVTVADDPSLYSTIVVSGAPMGVDNRVITITRDDVLNTAFGISTLTSSDRKKYGQTVDYPISLINQGAPVRFMRVTPEGSTYGFSCIVIQWRIDETDNKMHVRFLSKDLPTEIQLVKFQNTDRLNTALVNYYKNDSVTDVGYEWKQRVFMTNITAGRGSVYNYFTNAINTTSQSKKPANIKYEFVTIDSRDNLVYERFYASLVNTNSADISNAIDTVNTLVNRRVEASSIIVPYINESVVHEVYNEYMIHFKEMIDSTSTDEFTNNAYIAMNVNIFDIIYGNYIYNGTDDTKMPFYQVDMFDTEIPSLPTTNRIETTAVTFDEENPVVLYDKLMPLTYGVNRDGDNVYVGDIYLNTIGNSNFNPTITIVSTINQYTGAITSLTIPKLYPLSATTGDGGVTTYVVNKEESTPVAIKTIFNDTTSTDGSGSRTIKNLVYKETVVVGDIVALVSGNGFTLFTVTDANAKAMTYTLAAYTTEQIYQAFAWASHESGQTGVGNIIGTIVTDDAFARVGATVVDTATGKIYVNNYDIDKESVIATPDTFVTTGRILVEHNTTKFGSCPDEVNITTDIVGATYDIMAYADSNVDKCQIDSVNIIDAGSGYAVGDIVNLIVSDVEGEDVPIGTILTVSAVDDSGAVTDLEVTTVADETADILFKKNIRTESANGTGLTITVAAKNITVLSYKGNPINIERYIVSGVQGSLFRVAQDTATEVPANYYSDEFGLNMTSEVGGVRIRYGSTGFFDDDTINEIEYKWRYSALLVQAYRGQIDPRIMSPTRVSAKYLFDGGHNTIVGQTILPYITYTPSDIISASTIFTEDEKEEVMFTPSVIENITQFEDIDVKQAMYDLMIYRCYQGIPEEKRPVGPGSGLSLHLDAGITDADTAMLINTSFAKRFDNPNASWDIGGWVDMATGNSYTFTKKLVDNLTKHCKTYTVNKPFVGKYTTISKSEYSSYFPDIDTTDWDLRELLYNSGGNAWIADINGDLTRRSQRTLYRESDTSDLVQESNMRTLSQLVYLLQNKIDTYLLEYNDDGVLKTLSDEVNNMFSNWVGTYVDDLDISFQRDINIDGGEILTCNCNVTFRGLILRVPIIVNVNRRSS